MPINLADPVNRSHPLARGLVNAWVPLPNNSGGTTLFDVVGARSAPLTGGSAWRAGYPPVGGLSAFTDGTQRIDGQGSVPEVVFNDPGINATMFALCRPLASGSAGGVWAVRSSGSGGAGLYIEFSSSLAAVARAAGDGGSSATATTTATATVNQWCAIAGTYRALATSPERTAYLNGVGVTNTTAVGTNGQTADRYGTANTGFMPAPFGLELAAVLLWPSRVLSASEVWGVSDEALRGFPTLFRRQSTASWFVGLGGGGGQPPNTAGVAWLVA